MKLLEKVKEIANNHPFKPIDTMGHKNVYDLIREHPEMDNPVDPDYELSKKYIDNIPNGWYGFSLGRPIPKEWVDILNETLTLCIENDPELEIHQIKIKFGGIRFYVESNVIEDIFDIENYLENLLRDKALIY